MARTVPKGNRNEGKQGKKKKSFLRFLGWGTFFPILAEAAVGILLLALTGEDEALSFAVGAIFAFLGVFLIASVFLAGGGIFCLGCGAAFAGFAVWLFVQPAEAVNVLLYALVALLFARSLFGMWNALGRKKEGGKWWEIQIFVCLAVAVADFVLFFAPFSFPVKCAVLGALYLCEAVLGLCAGLSRLFSRRGKGKEERGREEPQEQTQARANEETAETPDGEPVSPKKRRGLFGGKKDGKS